MNQHEVEEKSKGSLMEELMAKLKEDLMERRKHVAVKEDVGVSMVNGEGQVKVEKAEEEDNYVLQDVFVKEEVVIEDVVVEEMNGEKGNDGGVNGLLLEKESTSEDKVVRKCTSTGGLKTHMIAVNQKEKPFVCKEIGCSRTFGGKSLLNRHIRCVHPKEKPFPCKEPGCGKKFGSRYYLTEH